MSVGAREQQPLASQVDAGSRRGLLQVRVQGGKMRLSSVGGQMRARLEGFFLLFNSHYMRAQVGCRLADARHSGQPRHGGGLRRRDLRPLGGAPPTHIRCRREDRRRPHPLPSGEASSAPIRARNLRARAGGPAIGASQDEGAEEGLPQLRVGGEKMRCPHLVGVGGLELFFFSFLPSNMR
jgi:hypothetical protein